MKKSRCLTLFSGLILTAASLMAQTSATTAVVDTSCFFGVMRVTPIVANQPAADAPKGYHPVYLTHYGRHGARWATNERSYNLILHTLASADSMGVLTPLGKEFRTAYLAYYPQLQGHAGELTLKGQAQHRAVASAMVSRYPKLFAKGRVVASSSIVPRCIVSMYAFCSEVQQHYPKTPITAVASPGDMAFLSPCSPTNEALTPADKLTMSSKAPWRKELDAYALTLLDPTPFMARLFTDVDAMRVVVSPLALQRAVYALYSGRDCLDFPTNIPFTKLLTFDEVQKLWEADNVVFYMMEGPGLADASASAASAATTDASAKLPVQSLNRYAVTLVRDIVDRAEADLASDCTVRLRFGHDMTLMGLLSLLQADTWGEQAATFATIKQTWQNSRIPMASNMQLVVYRGKHTSDPLLFRMVVNGEPQRLPLTDQGNHFYRWSDFTEFCKRL